MANADTELVKSVLSFGVILALTRSGCRVGVTSDRAGRQGSLSLYPELPPRADVSPVDWLPFLMKVAVDSVSACDRQTVRQEMGGTMALRWRCRERGPFRVTCPLPPERKIVRIRITEAGRRSA